MSGARARLLVDLAAFLTQPRSDRPRALVVHGVHGTGKTTFLDLLQVELLDAGHVDVIVVDDADRDLVAGARRVRTALDDPAGATLVVAVQEVSGPLLSLLAARCELRMVELPLLDASEVDDLLESLGLHRWTLHAQQVVAAGAGVPGAIIERSFEEFDPACLPPLDRSFDGAAWSHALARHLEETSRGGHGHDAAVVAEPEDDQLAADPDTVLARAELALAGGDLEAAVRLGEAVAHHRRAPEPVRLLGACSASSARALRSEPMSLRSLRALTARAERAGLPVVEAVMWRRRASVAIAVGDVDTARTAAGHAVRRSDEAGAVAIGLRARIDLARTHLASGAGAAAATYLREVELVARARGLHGIRVDATRVLAAAETVGTPAAPITRRFMPRRSRPDTRDPGPTPDAFAILTRREREVAHFVAGGLTNPEIAAELHLSPRTVEHHVSSILRKLELSSRRALVLGRV